jgi:hypothetical protein
LKQNKKIMTKTIVVGSTEIATEKKPIKFFSSLRGSLEFNHDVGHKPSDFNYVELIAPNYTSEGRDLMFAYDDPNDRSRGLLYVGYWNDGVVDNS